MNREAFMNAVVQLQQAGYETVNPHDVELPIGVEKSAINFIKADIIEMMRCDGVATIGAWQESWGARIETDLAFRIPMPVRPLELWAQTVLKLKDAA